LKAKEMRSRFVLCAIAYGTSQAERTHLKALLKQCSRGDQEAIDKSYPFNEWSSGARMPFEGVQQFPGRQMPQFERSILIAGCS
jgi:hypothetical protein